MVAPWLERSASCGRSSFTGQYRCNSWSGDVLEPWFGARKLIGLFCAGGLFASLCSHLAGVQASDGASGGAFALLGALVFLSVDLKLAMDEEVSWLLRGPVRWLAGLNLVLPIGLTFLDGVGHLGGFVAGIGLLWVSYRHRASATVLETCAISVVAFTLVRSLLLA